MTIKTIGSSLSMSEIYNELDPTNLIIQERMSRLRNIRLTTGYVPNEGPLRFSWFYGKQLHYTQYVTLNRTYWIYTPSSTTSSLFPRYGTFSAGDRRWYDDTNRQNKGQTLATQWTALHDVMKVTGSWYGMTGAGGGLDYVTVSIYIKNITKDNILHTFENNVRFGRQNSAGQYWYSDTWFDNHIRSISYDGEATIGDTYEVLFYIDTRTTDDNIIFDISGLRIELT